MDFYLLRCNQTGDDVSLQDVECGDVDEHSWSGVIMKSSCSSHGHQSTNDCQTGERLNMTLQKELPVFDSVQIITYRSIACARCNNEDNFSFWGLDISCEHTSSISTPVSITAAKILKFLKEHPDCSWKYAPLNVNQQFRSCVLQDTRCSSNQLPVMSVVRELCQSYSMVVTVVRDRWPWSELLTYRNPHCALCNPEGKSTKSLFRSSPFPPLSILLDVSEIILASEGQASLQPELFPLPDSQNLTSQLLNYATLVGNSLSIISLCFLLIVYLSFKDLSENLPGKCLINLSLALLCYQAIFLGAAKLSEVDPLCKVVASFVHFFILAAYAWMSVMAFDIASTLTVQGKFTALTTGLRILR